MAFNQDIRRVKDTQLPIARRYVALRSAVTRFSPNGFNGTFSNLAAAVGHNSNQELWTEQQLEMAADLLQQSRDLYLLNKMRWDHERSRNKSLGVSAATPAELANRDTDSWFDSVSAGTRRRRYEWLSLAGWAEAQGLTLSPFGPELAHDLEVVNEAMPESDLAPAGRMIVQYGPFPKLLEPANVIAIPYRVYAPPIPQSRYDSLTPTQKTVADCLYSRSHDGHKRQLHIKRIVAVEELWVIPYVVAAIGDYVVEVVDEVVAGLADLDKQHSWQESKYRQFADHNADFIELTRQRAVSYWDCYYSRNYSLHDGTEKRPRYPSLEVLESIGRPAYGMAYRTQTS